MDGWTPTMELRWLPEKLQDERGRQVNYYFPHGIAQQPYRGGVMTAQWRLQQKWLSDIGAVQWRDVDVVAESSGG